MSLDQASPADRAIVRSQGRWLAFWTLLVGLGADMALLYGAKLHSMGLRYAAVVAAMYLAGFLAGGWWCARRWRLQAHSLRHARRRSGADGRKSESSWYDSVDILQVDWDGLLLVVLFLAVFGLCWGLGTLMAELLAGYLAEALIGFAIGTALYRRMRRRGKPQPLGAYWGFMLRRTALYAVFAALMAGLAGAALQRQAPEAHTLLQALTARPR